MYLFRWQVAGGKIEDFPFEDSDIESFTILFRYSKGLPRDALKVGDELLKYLAMKEQAKATPEDMEHVARNTLKKGKFKTHDAKQPSDQV